MQQLVLPDALAGADVLATSPDRLRQDARLRDPRRRAQHGCARRPAALSSFRRASSPRRSSTSSHRSPRRSALKIAAVYGGTSVGAQAKRAQGRPDPRRDARPSTRSDRAEARLAAWCASSSWTKRIACSTWAFGPRSTAILRDVPDESSDAALLGDARGRRARPRAALHRQPGASRPSAAAEQAQGEIDHRFVPVTADTKLGRLAEQSARTTGGRSSSSAPSTAPIVLPESSRASTAFVPS